MNSLIPGRQNCLVRAFPLPWRRQYRLWVIRGIHRQQAGLHRGRTTASSVRTSRTAHRPGPGRSPVEFGSKSSVSLVDGIARVDTLRWDAFAGTGDLTSQCDVCQRRDGHYPAKVLTDGVYGNRTNRRWLKVHGIAFADKPLGRPPRRTPAEQKAANAQRHADAGAHIPIEGKCGQGKGAYGLDTSETCSSGSSSW